MGTMKKTPRSKKEDATLKVGQKFRIGYGTENAVEEFENGYSMATGYHPAIVRFYDAFGYWSWEYAYKCEAV